MLASDLIKKQHPERKIYRIETPASFAEANITFMENMLGVYISNEIVTEETTEKNQTIYLLV